jgi:hypothetical protein
VLEKEDYWEGLDESEGCLDRWFVGEGIGLLGLRLDWLVGGEIDRDVAGHLMMQRNVRRVLGIE